MKRLVEKRARDGTLNAPTDKDKRDTGKDRALARTANLRARRDALVEGARARELTVREYAKQLRAAGDDVTEEDMMDAEIADANAGVTNERPDDDPNKKDDDADKGDGNTKASL